MMIDVFFVDDGSFGHHCPNMQCFDCDEFGHFAQDCPNKIPPSGNTMLPREILFKASIFPHTRDSSHSPTMVTDMGYISTNHNPATVPTMTGAAVSEDTQCSSSSHCSSSCCPFGQWVFPLTICAMTYPTSIVTPHPTLTTSPADITHAHYSMDWSWSCSSNSHHTTQEHRQENPGHAQEP